MPWFSWTLNVIVLTTRPLLCQSPFVITSAYNSQNKNSVAAVRTCVFKKGKSYQETRWKRKFKSTKKVVHIKAKCRNYSWLIYGRWIKEEVEEKLTKEWLGSRDELVPPERDPCISYQSLFEIMYVASVESNMFFFSIDNSWLPDLSLFSFHTLYKTT